MRLGSGRNRCKTNATDDIHHFFSARFLICGALHLNQKCLFSEMICKTLDQPMAYVHEKYFIYLPFRTIVGEGAPSLEPKKVKRGPTSIARRVATGACGTGTKLYSLHDSRYCPAVPTCQDFSHGPAWSRPCLRRKFQSQSWAGARCRACYRSQPK